MRPSREMQKTPLFDYLIEAVIEDVPGAGELPKSDHIRYVVPRNYITPDRSLFKTRGLNYALEASDVPDDAWLVHLGEETQPTSSGIRGICQMIREEEESGRLRVGQEGMWSVLCQ